MIRQRDGWSVMQEWRWTACTSSWTTQPEYDDWELGVDDNDHYTTQSEVSNISLFLLKKDFWNVMFKVCRIVTCNHICFIFEIGCFTKRRLCETASNKLSRIYSAVGLGNSEQINLQSWWWRMVGYGSLEQCQMISTWYNRIWWRSIWQIRGLMFGDCVIKKDVTPKIVWAHVNYSMNNCFDC
jgi:hypothetical protein